MEWSAKRNHVSGIDLWTVENNWGHIERFCSTGERAIERANELNRVDVDVSPDDLLFDFIEDATEEEQIKETDRLRLKLDLVRARELYEEMVEVLDDIGEITHCDTKRNEQ
jgi:hypothetical protein